MPDEKETLLENEDGTIVADGPLLLRCICPGGLMDGLVRLYAPFALTASIIVSTMVALRAAPGMILLVSISWTAASVAGYLVARRENRKHGRFRLDLESGELLQEGRGFSRTLSLRDLKHVAMPVVDGIEASRADVGFEARWLLLVMKNGEELRLGKATRHSLRPVLMFLREAQVPVLGEQEQERRV